MLPQHRGGAAGGGRAATHPDERPDDALRPGHGVLEVAHHAHRPHLRVVGHLLREVHDRRGHAGLVEQREPLLRRALQQPLLDLLPPALDTLHVRLVGGVEVGAVGLVLDAEQRSQRLAVLPRDAAEHERARPRVVAAVVEAVRREALGVPAALGDQLLVGRPRRPQLIEAFDERVAQRDVVQRLSHDVAGEQLQRRVQQRDVQLLPLASERAVVEGGVHAHRRDDAGGAIGVGRGGDLTRRAGVVRPPLGGHQAGVALRHDVGAGAPGLRPPVAEAGDRGVDQVGAERRQRLVVDPELARRLRAVVDHHHVEARQQAVDQRAPLRPGEIDDQAALAAVERLEVLPSVRDDRAGVAPRLPLRRLDLHDVRAEVGEVEPGGGARDDLRELEHADAVQRAVRAGRLAGVFVVRHGAHPSPAASGSACRRASGSRRGRYRGRTTLPDTASPSSRSSGSSASNTSSMCSMKPKAPAPRTTMRRLEGSAVARYSAMTVG